jgi:hypothetical protein
VVSNIAGSKQAMDFCYFVHTFFTVLVLYLALASVDIRLVVDMYIDIRLVVDMVKRSGTRLWHQTLSECHQNLVRVLSTSGAMASDFVRISSESCSGAWW